MHFKERWHWHPLSARFHSAAGALGARHYHRHKRRLCKGSADRFGKAQGCAECRSCWPCKARPKHQHQPALHYTLLLIF